MNAEGSVAEGGSPGPVTGFIEASLSASSPLSASKERPAITHSLAVHEYDCFVKAGLALAFPHVVDAYEREPEVFEDRGQNLIRG